MTLKQLLKKEERKNEKRLRKKKGKQQHILSIYFGVPGSGKTTFAAWLAKRDMKRGHDVYSNVPITGAYKLDCKEDIGKHMICDARVIIDEAGIEYNNRNFKSFGDTETYFFKYHRHYQCAVDVFSQGYDDMDKKLRVLAQRLYVVKRTILPWVICRKRIGKRVGINEVTKEVIDEYFFVPLGTRFIWSPSVWKMFNTVSRKDLPQKEWERW